MRYTYKERTKRHLPHLHPPGAKLFVTFRLVDSVPAAVLRSHKAWLDAETRRLRTSAGKPEQPTATKSRLLERQRRWFKILETALHSEETGPTWLRNQRVASVVEDALHWRDGKVYELDAYSILPNHVHVVFEPYLSGTTIHARQTYRGRVIESEDPPLDVIMHSLKSWTATQANLLLGRRGQFWQHESYDHVVRNNDEFIRIVNYVLQNPVKSGLVKDWRDWRWTWKRT
jgi:REP element-mobilizing transposase RayT